MAGIDNRIVTMQFNNRDFEANARTSLSTLQKLKESMSFGSISRGTIRAISGIGSSLMRIGKSTPFSPLFTAAERGFGFIGNMLGKLGIRNPFSSSIQGASDLQKAAQAAGGPAGMGVLEGGVTAVSNKFIALSTIAITALSNITNRAINSGATFLKSFTFGPVLQGLHEYETNLKSIQTVQANTDQPLDKVNASLEELNKYSDQTIYNFSEMARNVGTFTAAGVDLETSVSSIKGIANLAALSGSSSQQAAAAMYQLSQAIASGRVSLMDWNSVVNAGMGGKKLQNALAQTAVAMGVLNKEQVKLVGSMEKLEIKGTSFRESIMAGTGNESWLSSEVLVNTLAIMDGRFSKAALAAERTEEGLRKYSDAQIAARIETARTNLEQKNGVKYTDEQFAALQKMSTQAFKSATEVKTLGQAFDIVKETIGSGWSASFKNIFGDLNEAKKTFTAMKDELAGIVDQNALARNRILNAWKEGGGRADVIEGIRNSWKALLGLLKPIQQGFRDIFPAKTAKNLLDMSERFKEFTKSLIPGKETMSDIRDIASGVFSVFGIAKQILAGVVTLFTTIFSIVGAGNGSFLDFAGSVGNTVERFHDFLAESGLITAFFEGLGKILSVPIALLQSVADIFNGMFSGFNEGAANQIGKAVDGIGQRLSGLAVVGERLTSFFSKIGEFFGNIGGHIADALMGVGDMVANAFSENTFDKTLDVVNTTLLGGLVLLLKSFFTKGVQLDFTGGLFDGIKETLGAATGAFENMQAKLKADILIRLAGAIAVMTAALFVLSTIDSGAMTKALTAMTVGFGILIAALGALMKFLGAAGLVQMYVVTSAMTKMAFSILIMGTALKILAGINFGDMIRGLVGLSAMLFILTKAMIPLAAGSKGMGKASASLILVAIAMNLFAIALKIFATMSWEEMIRGLAGLAGVLGVMVVALKAMPEMGPSSLSLIAFGIAMNLLAVSMKIFATMSWEEIARGLTAVAGSLAIIAAGLKAMPQGILLQSVALIAVAGAMVVLSGALKIMGSMGWEAIAKGMVVLAGAMTILAIGLRAIGLVGTIGAVGLLAAAGALTVLVPVLVSLGAMSWESIVKGLTGIAGLFVILGIAGTLLGPITPVIIGLGAAMLVLGAGMALAGAGALAAATAFGIVVAAGAAGAQIMVQFLNSVIQAIPPALAAFGKGVVQFAVAIGKGAPKIMSAFGKLLSNLISQVTKNTPKLGRMFLVMLNAALRVIVTAVPRIVNAGLTLILRFLEAISRNVGKMTNIATDIIVKFLNALGRNMPRIIEAGVKLIIKFVEGTARAVRNNSSKLGSAGADLALALVEGTARGITAFGGRIRDAALSAARSAWESVKDFFKIGSPSKLMRDTIGKPLPQGIAVGVREETPVAVRAIEDLGKTTVSKLDRVMKGVDDAFVLDPNLNPTISPVLDLTALTKEANKIGTILTASPILPTVSYQAAAEISALSQPSSSEQSSSAGASGSETGGNTYQYIQNLHSPEPLDSVKIYRNGKSLISMKKEELTK